MAAGYKQHCSGTDTPEVPYNLRDSMILALENVTIQKSSPTSFYTCTLGIVRLSFHMRVGLIVTLFPSHNSDRRTRMVQQR